MLGGVIRLRTMIERGLRNPWLRPVLIIVLALMLGLLVLHSTSDQNQIVSDGGPLLACLAIAFLLGVRFAAKPLAGVVRVRRSVPRAPPRGTGLSYATVRTQSLDSPLRL